MKILIPSIVDKAVEYILAQPDGKFCAPFSSVAI
jgi:hypothetical protein